MGNEKFLIMVGRIIVADNTGDKPVSYVLKRKVFTNRYSCNYETDHKKQSPLNAGLLFT